MTDQIRVYVCAGQKTFEWFTKLLSSKSREFFLLLRIGVGRSILSVRTGVSKESANIGGKSFFFTFRIAVEAFKYLCIPATSKHSTRACACNLWTNLCYASMCRLALLLQNRGEEDRFAF